MGIASVMSTLLSLSMTTSFDDHLEKLPALLGGQRVQALADVSSPTLRTVSISRRFSVPLASRARQSSSFALALSSRSVMNLR